MLSLVLKEGILDHHCQSIDGWSKTAQIVLPQNKVKKVMGELHARFSRQYLDISNTLSEVKQHCCWLHMSSIEWWCQQHA
jgi:hypothetical protein